MPEARIQKTVGRDEELARLSAFLDRVGEGPAALLLDGEAGIGKTELWRAGVAEARRRGYEVLEARPAEAESRLSFAGLADLLAGVLDEVEALPAPRRRPLAVALLLEDASGPPPDPRAIAVALLEVLRAVARRGPLLVAVDDVQWLDPASSAAVGFALRRAAGERVGVLLARRSGIDAALEVDRAIPRDLVDVGPLSFGATQRLLRERLESSFSRSTLRLVHDRAGGNPFFALELARALGDRGVSLAPGDELPVPADLGRLLRDRLAALPPRDRGAARGRGGAGGAAVAARRRRRPPRPGVRGRSAGARGRAGALRASAAGRGGLRRGAAGPPAGAPSPARRRGRRSRAACAATRPRRRRAATRGGSRRRRRRPTPRGAPEAAAELAERAVGLDPERRSGGAGEARRRGRPVPRARGRRPTGAAAPRGRARRTRRRGPPGRRLRLAMARCLRNVDAIIAELEAALAEAGGDARLEAEAIGQLAGVIGSTRSVADAEPYARAAVDAAERTGDPALLASALCTLAVIEFFLGRGVPVGLMERALALEPECDTLPIGERPVTRFGLDVQVGRRRRPLARAARGGGADRRRARRQRRRRAALLLVLPRAALGRTGGAAWSSPSGSSSWESRPSGRTSLLYGLGARAVLLARLGDEAGTRRDAGEADRAGGSGPG